MITPFMHIQFLLFFISITMIIAQSDDESNSRFGSRSRCLNKDDLDLESINLPPLLNPIIAKPILNQIFERLPEICITFSFNFCADSPSIHLNITRDGITVVDEDFSEDTEICEDKDISGGGCKSCVGIKDGELIIKPNYGKICPHYFMKCEVMGFEIPLNTDQAVEIPCEPWGNDCTAASIDACLETKGCGWCDGGGTGIEFNDDTGSPSGKGCTATLVTGETKDKKKIYEPFCANCDPNKFYVEKRSRSSAGLYIENNPGQIAGITIAVAIVVLLLVGLFVYFLRKKKNRQTSSFAKIN